MNSPFAQFVTRLYNDLVLPLAIPVALLALAVAVIMFMTGNRHGLERAVQVLLGTLLLGFGPFIVNWVYNTARGLGQGAPTQDALAPVAALVLPAAGALADLALRLLGS